ncbi:hypothetical protein [Kordia sp.]|uniref:hypothetical protein n=1 Tax=Kordia sp. TaxID=1965332 RepID=UPI003B5936B4
MKNYKFDKHWYLGFLGVVGFYKFPEIIAYFQGQESIWGLLNLLWFTWFAYFFPEFTKHSK